MTVGTVAQVIETLAPLHLAESWDNVGLLAGARDWPAERLFLTIDLTGDVLEEAIDAQRQMIIAYHPPIFQPLQSITDASPRESIILRALQSNIAMHSPHTAIDAAPGGVNDWLADGLGLGDVRALSAHEHLPESEQCKLITFAPESAVERLREALASAGAGRIGDYSLCSFELRGTGTFHGGESTSPAIGEKGQLEHVDEVRLEMVCPRAALGIAVATLREFHPYEEPPIEIYELQPRPQRHIGAGRRVVLDQAVSINELASRVKEHLGIAHLRVAPSNQGMSKIQTIGLCAGAGGSLLDAAIAQGCDAFLTGEMRHHDVLSAQARGCAIILAGHTNTERGYLPVLKDKLAARLEAIDVAISRADRDPLRVM